MAPLRYLPLRFLTFSRMADVMYVSYRTYHLDVELLQSPLAYQVERDQRPGYPTCHGDILRSLGEYTVSTSACRFPEREEYVCLLQLAWAQKRV